MNIEEIINRANSLEIGIRIEKNHMSLYDLDSPLSFIKISMDDNQSITMNGRMKISTVKDIIGVIGDEEDREKVLKKGKWTDPEVQFLRDNYGLMTFKEMGEKLNRSEQTVQSKSVYEGISKKQRNWTKEEDSILRKYRDIRTHKELSKLLNRSVQAVGARIHVLKNQ